MNNRNASVEIMRVKDLEICKMLHKSSLLLLLLLEQCFFRTI